MSYQIITKQQQLNELVAILLEKSVIAIDTEFVRQRTYFPLLGLIQINSGDATYLIDPVDIDDWSQFNRILASQDIIKVIHSCSEDVEVFKSALGVKVSAFYDTQVAEAHLNKGNALGLALLVERYKNVKMDKGQARTDWLQRPLSDKQLNYASEDVRWLLDIYKEQSEALGDSIVDVMEDIALIVGKKHRPLIAENAWRDVKSNWQLNPRQLAVLKELAQWRMNEAINRDLALNFVVNERSLVLLAEQQPSTLNAMKAISGIHPMEVRKHGKTLLDCIAKGLSVADDDCPAKVARLVEEPKYKKVLLELKSVIKTFADDNGIATELLASKRQLNQFIAYHWQLHPWSKDLQPELCVGWRGRLVGSALLEALNKF